MADVKWIKITTDIFDDEKMKIIDTMPVRDEIIVIWFKLLSLAGKVNQDGLLIMNNKISYTPEMLTAIFNRKLNTVKLALSTFEGFGMIDIEDGETIGISNWNKHQNIEGMEKIREQNRLRKRKERENKHQKSISHTMSRDSHATDKIRLEEDKKKNKIKDIKHKYGEYKHILLTDEQYNSLLEDWGLVELDRMIKILDEGMEMNPKYKYKNFKIALTKWKGNNYNSSPIKEHQEDIEVIF